jgi:hypothetical protein
LHPQVWKSDKENLVTAEFFSANNVRIPRREFPGGFARADKEKGKRIIAKIRRTKKNGGSRQPHEPLILGGDAALLGS